MNFQPARQTRRHPYIATPVSRFMAGMRIVRLQLAGDKAAPAFKVDHDFLAALGIDFNDAEQPNPLV